MRGLLLLALQSVVIAVEQASSGITLTFYAKHQAELTERLRSILLNISDPRNEQYGQYLSLEQAAAYQQPAAESVRAIEAHVAELGGVIESRTLAGDKIVVRIRNANVTAAEIVPTSLQLHVDLVDGPAAILGSTFRSLRNVPRPVRHRPERRMEVTKDPLECLADKVTAKCLRAAYGLNGTVGTNVTNGQAVVVNQMYKQSDLDAFLKESGLAPQKITHNIGKLDGSAGDEASLDTQFIIATGSQVPTWWVYIDGHAANPFSNWLVWASNNSAIPFVHSLSVGEPEGEAVDFIARMNAEMMALGARGISIIFASGDSGYAEEQKFGSSSPYVTSVGGVYNGDLGNSALEVDEITTGGFSSLDANPIQPWQQAAVAAYLQTSGERPSHLNASRRCCPDLSVYDAGYYIIQDGSETPIGGTSAAAPALAGMISLINDARLNAGRPPMGFLNPFLYQNQAAFLDVTRGSNNGFAAVKGYDPASGLGTFDHDTFSKLLAAALQ